MKCRLDRIEVNYEVHGEGRPMVLLHGFSVDHRQMAGTMEPAFVDRDGWQRIYPDLPGMGATPGPDWLRNSDHMLAVMGEFVDAVIPGSDFAVGGYSYGGYLAMGLQHQRPELTTGLLMICPVIVAEMTQRDLPGQVPAVVDQQMLDSLSEAERADAESWMAVQTSAVMAQANESLGPGFELRDEAFISRLQEEGYPFDPPLSFPAEPFDLPTLIVAGRQDWITGYRDAWPILEHYRRATFAVLDRAGHELPVSQGSVLNGLISEWLDRVEESLG